MINSFNKLALWRPSLATSSASLSLTSQFLSLQHDAVFRLGGHTFRFHINLALLWIVVILILTSLAIIALVFAGIARRRAREAELANIKLEQEASQRSRAESALNQSEEQYRLLFDSNPQPMWVYDIQTLRFLAVNNVAVEMYGYSRGEFLSMTIRDIRPPEEIPALMENIAKTGDGIAYSDRWLHRRKDGTVIHVEIVSHPLVFEGRTARLTMANDVTRREQLETQLRQAQKMEAVGRLAGGIAHDFNNLLTVIMGYGDLVAEALTSDSGLSAFMHEINHAADRASSLTGQLLAFSRQQVMVPKVLDLNVVLGDINRMLQRLIGDNVEISIMQSKGLGLVKADLGQIEQVIVNLAINARDAMPQGGRLTLETANVELDESYVQAHAGAKPGSYVMLAVSDTGTGMGEQVRGHIFEPFFTTKEPGKGTGLGLSTVYGIVKQSGGNIWLYSEPGRGTTFKIYLPQIQGNPDLSDLHGPGRTRTEAPGGSETVLLVEDDVSLRSFIRRVLEGRGYRILEAKNGAEAIQISDGFDGRIDFVLTDVVMPKIGGRELATTMTARRDGIKILYMSGYTDDVVILNELLEARMPYLQKPFTADTLARKVRDVLDTE